VNSSGLSAYVLQQRQRGRHHMVGLAAGAGGSAAAGAWGSQPGHEAAVSAALRALLLTQHDVALEQFGSLQEALEYLEQFDEQGSLVGLAAEDYSNDHKQYKQQRRRHRQDGQYPGMYVKIDST
jgi:hypothetical protein